LAAQRIQEAIWFIAEGAAQRLDVTPRIKPGEINVFKFSDVDKTPRGFRVRITTRDELCWLTVNWNFGRLALASA
jgi:hypothetical protein